MSEGSLLDAYFNHNAKNTQADVEDCGLHQIMLKMIPEKIHNRMRIYSWE